MSDRTRIIVYGGVLAAAYAVFTWVLQPISYGPVQFRVSELLKPAALFSPVFAIAFGIGNGMANLLSPFGAWDFVVMSVVDTVAALTCFALRKIPLVGVTVQAVMISLGVAVFPLHFGGGMPILPNFILVLISEMILLVGGYYFIWRNIGPILFGKKNESSHHQTGTEGTAATTKES